MPVFTLRITGQASISQFPSQAILYILLTLEGWDKQDVCGEVLAEYKRIKDAVRPHQAQASPMRVTIVSIPTDTSDRPDTKDPTAAVSRCRARVEVKVCIEDFDFLEQFSFDLASFKLCKLGSLSWEFDDECTMGDFKRDLRVKAATDARAKVKDYCQTVLPDEAVTIIPVELKNEIISDNTPGSEVPRELSSQADRARHALTGYRERFVSRQGSHGDYTDVDWDWDFEPRVRRLSLSIDLTFNVETMGFKLSSV